MKTESIRLEDLEPGDEFLFLDRSQPCLVEESERVTRRVGSIRVHYQVSATGPQGVEITLQRTGSGRGRVRASGPYGAFANLDGSVRRVQRAKVSTPTESVSGPSDREIVASIARGLFE